jgi:hypothetical protein
MTTTIDLTIEVPLADLRNAITAVVVHAEPTKAGDEVTAYQRVRLTAGKDELLVAATSGTTAALAAVPILEDSRKVRFSVDDGAFHVDLSPGLTRSIVRQFHVGPVGVDANHDVARLDFTVNDVTVTDVSGLWPGLALTLPTLPFASDYPDVHGILGKAFGAAGEAQAAKPLVAQAGLIALFRHAGTAYGRPLQFEASGPATARGFIVWCGPQFVGSVSSQHNDDDSLAKRQSERRAHLERLGLQPALSGL